MSEPETPEEWQAAIDAADLALLIDAAVQFGLVVFSGKVNADRCFDLLDRGGQLGYFPTPKDRRRKWIAWYVSEMRRQTGYSQRKLAARIGMSQPWISQVEREMADCDDRTVAAIRAVFTSSGETAG